MLMRHGDYGYGMGLSARGENQSDNIAKQLAENNLIPDVIVHSPVKRAVQTAQRVHDVFNRIAGKDVPMVEREWLADGNYSSVENVATLDDTQELVLAVSHMPNIESLNESLTGDYSSPGNCQTYVVETQAEHWKDVRKGSILAIFQPS